MIKLKTIFYAFSALALLSSCGNNNSTEGKNNDSITATDNKAGMADTTPVVLNSIDQLDSSYNEKTIVVEGYLALPAFMMVGKEKLGLEFFPRKNQANGWHATADIAVGSGNNTMNQLGEKYKPEDFVLRDNSGQSIKENERVKIRGKVNAYSGIKGEQYVSISVSKIEKVQEVELDYSKLNAIKLTMQNYNQDSTDQKLVYIEGSIAFDGMMMMASSSGDRYMMDLTGTPLGEKIDLYILIGKGPNQMEEVKDNFTKKDIKIYDKTGKLVGAKKIRAYGAYRKVGDMGTIEVEQIVTF